MQYTAKGTYRERIMSNSRPAFVHRQDMCKMGELYLAPVLKVILGTNVTMYLRS